LKRTRAFSSDIPPPQDLDEFGLSGSEPLIDRAAILAKVGVKNDVTSIEGLTSAAQGIAADLFLSQAAICLKSQQEFYQGTINHVAIEQFRVLNICSDMMRELTGYDIALDPNKAIETLERQGYKVLPGKDSLNANENITEEIEDNENANEATTD